MCSRAWHGGAAQGLALAGRSPYDNGMINLRFRPITLLVLAILFAVPAVAEEVWFAGVASQPGANATRWRSEVVLHNATATAQQVELELRARGSDTAGPTKTLSLAAGEVKGLPDLYTALGAPAGSGSLRVEGSVMTWVRTFNQGEEGTFGQDVPAVRFAAAVPPDEVRLFPATTSQNIETGFRSNLLLLNLGGTAATFTVRGCGATTSLPVPGGAYDQLNNLGQWLGCPNGPFVAEVEADGPWFGYVSTIDPSTGDPTTVSGMAPPTTGEPGNHPPVVALLTAEPSSLPNHQTAELRGVFYDPDQHAVSWTVRVAKSSTGGGQITGPVTGSGNLVTQVQARKPGLLVLEVTVNDGHGGVSKAVTGISVR